MKPWITRATGIALIVLAFAIGACDDEPEAGPDTTPSVTPIPPHSETASPTETTSAPPALSPVETVRAWVEARNLVVAGQPADDVYALSTEDCVPCEELVEPVLDLYEDGGRYETDGWRVDAARRSPDFSRDQEVVTAVTFLAGRSFQTDGAEPEEFEAEKSIMRFKVTRVDGQWLVAAIGFVR